MQRIKINDLVQVITGKDKGKQGRVIAFKQDKVKVQGVALAIRHVKPRRQHEQGGIKEQEGFVHISNVMPVAQDGKPTRIRASFVNESEGAGKKVRISVRTGAPLA